VQAGEDREAFLAVYDETKRRFVPLPPDLGLVRLPRKGCAHLEEGKSPAQ